MPAATSDRGRVPRRTIDKQLPTAAEKAALRDLAAGQVLIQRSTANVSSPPTDAELDAEFGTPAEAGEGLIALLDDDGAGSAVYLVASTGSAWWYAALTKAT